MYIYLVGRKEELKNVKIYLSRRKDIIFIYNTNILCTMYNVFQLCLTLSRVAACMEEYELQNLWIEIGDHVEEISHFMKQFKVRHMYNTKR